RFKCDWSSDVCSSDLSSPPRDEVETKLAAVFAEVLGLEQVGIEDNFFEVGGHSLRAIRAVAQIRQVFEVEIEVHDLFSNAVVAELAEVIRTSRRVRHEPIPRLDEREY